MMKYRYLWMALGMVLGMATAARAAEKCKDFNELFEVSEKALAEGISLGQKAEPIAIDFGKLDPKTRKISDQSSDLLFETSKKAEESISQVRNSLVQIDGLIPASPIGVKGKSAEEAKFQALHLVLGAFLEPNSKFTRFQKSLMMRLMRALTCDMDDKLAVCQANGLLPIYVPEAEPDNKFRSFDQYAREIPTELSVLRGALAKGLECPIQGPKLAEKPQE